MSTSPSRSLAASAPGEEPIHREMQPFPYDSIPAGGSRHGISDGLDGGLRAWGSDSSAADAAARESQIRAQGRQEGLAEARKAFDEQLSRERASLTAAVAGFTHDRIVYFQKVEAEVVQLALSIARKILHREAQLDPMLLAAIVRVALDKIDGATALVLRVHPQHAAEWREYLALHMKSGKLPEITEDPTQRLDCCVLQTSMGTAVVGVEVQLKEIEQGLMDLLAARPGAAS